MALGTKIHFTLNYEIKTCLIRKLGQCLIVNFPDWYVAPWSCQSSDHFGSVELLGPGAWNYRMSVWNDCENLFILPERWGISPLTVVWNWLIPIKRCSLFFYSVTESFWTCEKGAKTSRFHEQPLCHFIIPCETIWKIVMEKFHDFVQVWNIQGEETGQELYVNFEGHYEEPRILGFNKPSHLRSTRVITEVHCR